MEATITIDFNQNPPVFEIHTGGASTFALLNAVASIKDILMKRMASEAVEEMADFGIEVTDDSLRQQLQQMVDSYNLTRKDEG
jgi:hypothetical protein